MYHARPSLNGNTREHFAEACAKIKEAQDALTVAFAQVSGDVLHPRNYQHIGNDNDSMAHAIDSLEARETYMRAMAEMTELHDRIAAILWREE